MSKNGGSLFVKLDIYGANEHVDFLPTNLICDEKHPFGVYTNVVLIYTGRHLLNSTEILA